MKKQKISVFVHFYIILVSSTLFSPSIEMVVAGTEMSKVSSGSCGSVLWNRTYVGPEFEFGYFIQVLGDGGYIIVGSTFSFNASMDVLLVRTDSEGNMLWKRTYGGPEEDVGYSLQVLGDGSFIVAGHTSFDSDMDIYLVKTDSGGNMLWNRTFGGPQLETAASIQKTSDGGYVIVGTTSSIEVISEDVYLLRIDSEGNMLWNRTYGRLKNVEGYPLFEFGSSVHETGDGGYIIAGSQKPLGKEGDVFMIKADSGGNMLWNKTYGGTNTEQCSSSIETSDGGQIIVGSTRIPFGEEDIYLVKTDSDGNMLWNRTYGGPGIEAGNSVMETGDGGYIIAGYKTHVGEENSDAYLVKTDSKGNMLWNMTYGGSRMERGSSVLATGDGGYTVMGIEASPERDTDVYLVGVAPCAIPSSISCKTSANTTITGDIVIVSGAVIPCVPRRDITLTYTLPDGTTLRRTVKTDEDGLFRDEHAPDLPGSWEVTASMEGDAYYEASTSEPAAFTVERPAQETPLYVYGSLATIAVFAVLIAWLLLRRR